MTPTPQDYAFTLATAELDARRAFDNPRTGRDPLSEALNAYRLALTQSGMLSADPAGPSGYDTEQAARYLAEQSRSRRYAGEDGWRRLLESPHNVEHAYRSATTHPDPRESARAALANARDLLLRTMTAGSEES